MANYNEINNVSEVSDRRGTTGGQNVSNKTTLTSVCRALSCQSCSQPGSRGRTSDSGMDAGISRFFVMETLRNLVLRGESAGHDRNHCSLSVRAAARIIPLTPLAPKHKTHLTPQPKVLLPVILSVGRCVGITIVSRKVFVCLSSFKAHKAFSDLFHKPGHWHGAVAGLQKSLSQIIT